MRNLLYILLFSSSILMGQVPSSGQNYIKTSVYKEPTFTINDDKAKVSVIYYDGLGRPIQQIAGKASGEGKDIITHIEYDGFGRQVKDYLPYAAGTSNLAFDGSALSNTFGFYSDNNNINETTSFPYNEKFLEASPLSRINKQAAPGDSWKGNVNDNNDHTIKYAYQANVSADNVKKLRAIASWNNADNAYGISYVAAPDYAPFELYKTITQDENKTGTVYTGTNMSLKMNTVEEFKNKEGQVVLKRTFNAIKGATVTYEQLNTYYVYDQFGNLTYVLQPMANGVFSPANLEHYAFQYRYDARNRMVEKKLPGKQWEYIVYDPLDRVVATGPALNPFGGIATGWLYTYYDAFNRTALTGWVPQTAINSNVRKTLQQDMEVENVSRQPFTLDDVEIDYKVGPPSTFKLLTVSYYDNYNWPGAPSAIPSSIEGENVTSSCRGLLTGTWVRALTIPSEKFADITYTVYDKKGRPLRTHIKTYTNGYTQTDTKMRFDGLPLYTITRHKRVPADAELVTREDFIYTPQDRLLMHTHKINSLPDETLAGYMYNEPGQMIRKSVGTMVGGSLQNIDYKYNVRGWLTDINNVDNLSVGTGVSDLFAFRIGYNTTRDDSQVGETPLYNGNISETYWRSASDNIQRKYSYNYDNVNRLLDAVYQKPGTNQPLANSYNEKLSYNRNGNIITLDRNGGLDDANFVYEIDELSYTYIGNRLRSITDGSASPQGFNNGATMTDEYTYDDNGNMLRDYNKGITSDITYNHLNLPVEIVFGGSATKKINYLYNAAGVKLKKTVTDGAKIMVVDYTPGGFQYKANVLQFFPTAEGYVDVTVLRSGEKTFKYVYQYKDHLGNVRMDFVAVPPAAGWITGTAAIKQENYYYAFGLKHMNYNMEELEFQESIETSGDIVLLPVITPSGKLSNNYKYQGQEWQDELGLGWYSFKWRNYDPAIARFMSIDPLTEDYEDYTPYQFASNQPVHAQEVEGLENSHDLNKRPAIRETPPPTANDAISRANNRTIPLKSTQSNRSNDALSNIKPISSLDMPKVQGGYVGESLDILVTKGIQELGELISGSEVSAETSQDVQLATTLLVVVASKGKNTKADGELAEGLSSRAARREAMRKEGIPTSQQPKSQSKNASGREYSYDVPKEGGGTQTKSVQQQTMDRSHQGQPHWEAGKVKTDAHGNTRTNSHGRPKLQNDKSKVDY